MKILVTGGAGFIGSHLVDALIKRKHRVAVIDDLSSGFREFVNPKARLYKVDVATPKVEKLVKRLRPEIIYHLAAQKDPRLSVEDPVLDVRTNVLGLAYLIRGAMSGKLKRFILASTGGAIYGGAKTIPTPEDYPAHPFSPYGVSKLASELYLHSYDHMGIFPYVSLRFSNVYGPRQTPKSEAGVVAIWAEALLRGKRPIIFGDGKQTRDFVYVDDVVRALLISAKKGRSQTFNIGTGKETSLRQLLRIIRGVSGSGLKPIYAPPKLGEERRSAIDPRRAKKILGWEPKMPLEKGIAKTISWIKDNRL